MINSLKAPIRSLFRVLYRLNVNGLEHLNNPPERVLIVANHVSFLDGIMLWAFLPGSVRFAINTRQADNGLIKYIIKPTGLFVLDSLNPMALKGFIAELRAGHPMGIFPEGRITHTGGLMKIYQGPAMAADKANAHIIPVHIEGAQFSSTSRLKGLVKPRWFPEITLTVLAPRKLKIDDTLQGRERRTAASHALAQIMSSMVVDAANTNQTLGHALTQARKHYGGRTTIIEDIQRDPWSFDDLLLKSHALGQLFAAETDPNETVGLMLPNSTACLASFMGMQLYGRVPAMINFSAGSDALRSAIHIAKLNTIYTSRRFIRLAELQTVIDALSPHVQIRYLEDLRDKATLGLKLRSFWRARTGKVPCRRQADDPAVILFTSGSEGTPKGVALSHRNVLSNRAQINARLPFSPSETFFNALPMFHSFGLTTGVLLPLLQGARIFLYPTPLHYKLIPELIYDTNATVLFGSNTFLAGYARHADPYDFHQMKYVVAGAEKLHETTCQIWFERFGIRIMEGYGATETSPVLSVNTPHAYRTGSVGQLLPNIEYKIKPVSGIKNAGELFVKGPNIMLGYLRNDRPGTIEPTHSEEGVHWYNTGDVVHMDKDGFLSLLDRTKRFAKIGGEMVSLGRVEELALRCWSEHRHIAITLVDVAKGERIVLLSEAPQATRKILTDHAKEMGLNTLSIPTSIIHVDEIPTLGTGKKDYASAKAIALANLSNDADSGCL